MVASISEAVSVIYEQGRMSTRDVAKVLGIVSPQDVRNLGKALSKAKAYGILGLDDQSKWFSKASATELHQRFPRWKVIVKPTPFAVVERPDGTLAVMVL